MSRGVRTDYDKLRAREKAREVDLLADVLKEHGVWGMSAGTHSACRCDHRWIVHAEYRTHLHHALTAAGIGVLP